MLRSWRLLLVLAHLAGALRVDEDPSTVTETPMDGLSAARAAAVGAHQAKLPPAEVAKVAAQATYSAGVASGSADKAADMAAKAAESALGTPAEVSKARSDAFEYVAPKLVGRTPAELAAADVAKSVEKAVAEGASPQDAVAAAHSKASEISEESGSGSYINAGSAPPPPAEKDSSMAISKGLTAMFKAAQSGAASGDIVISAQDAVKQAGGTPSDVEDIVAMASNPETFARINAKDPVDVEKAGDEAAKKAQSADYPLSMVAVIAARAAGKAQSKNPGTSVEKELDAAKEAAQRVLSRKSLSPQEASQESALNAATKAKENGEPLDQALDTARVAAMKAAAEAGAPSEAASQLADDAVRKVKVKFGPGEGSPDDAMWDKRVYAEDDRKEAQKR